MATSRHLPTLRDGRLELRTLRRWALEFDSLSEGAPYTAESFVDWLRCEVSARNDMDLAREHMSAAAIRRHAKTPDAVRGERTASGAGGRV